MHTLPARLALLSVAFILASCGDNGAAPRNHIEPPDTAGTERVLLEVPQWASNHNGGGMTFDNDGYLYLGLGDGGGSGDNEDNAQDPTNLLGSIIRVAVTDAAPWYEIPPDNPFAVSVDGWRGEIFAFGLRNPWRISYDGATGRLWAGDVGQNAWEEVDIIASGGNYGWDCREGLHEYTGSSSPECANRKNFIDPVWEYGHTSGNRSITGGYVYRGPRVPSLTGRYVYADYSSGNIWALDWDGQNASNEFLLNAGFLVSSFGVGPDGELYILEYAGTGRIHRFEGDGGGGYTVVEAFPGLTFDRPVDLRGANDGSGEIWVVEQNGLLRAFDSAAADSAWTVEDFTGRVVCCGEQGLLGLAFHPDFASNRHYYVYYTTTSGGALVGRLSRVTAE